MDETICHKFFAVSIEGCKPFGIEMQLSPLTGIFGDHARRLWVQTSGVRHPHEAVLRERTNGRFGYFKSFGREVMNPALLPAVDMLDEALFNAAWLGPLAKHWDMVASSQIRMDGPGPDSDGLHLAIDFNDDLIWKAAGLETGGEKYIDDGTLREYFDYFAKVIDDLMPRISQSIADHSAEQPVADPSAVELMKFEAMVTIQGLHKLAEAGITPMQVSPDIRPLFDPVYAARRRLGNPGI